MANIDSNIFLNKEFYCESFSVLILYEYCVSGELDSSVKYVDNQTSFTVKYNQYSHMLSINLMLRLSVHWLLPRWDFLYPTPLHEAKAGGATLTLLLL